VEVWRGGVASWECDEMGHMNVRFYVARAMQGLAGAAAALGMPEAFRAHAQAKLQVRQHHIRFLREAKAATPLHMTAGVLAMGDTDASLLQTLVHSRSGQTAATFVTQVTHVDREGRPFPWPERAREAGEALAVQPTREAGPRGILRPPPLAAEAAEAARLQPTGRGVVTAEDCDVFGRMRTELVLARVSDGLPHLLGELRRETQAAYPDRRIGGAAVEYQLVYYAAPAAGELYVQRSGVSVIDARRSGTRHWLLDARTGQPWATAEHLSVHFDLDNRKGLVLPDDVVQGLQSLVVRP
jgi:acyl-CoA thioester hydrolase